MADRARAFIMDMASRVWHRFLDRDRWWKTASLFSVAVVGTLVGDNIVQMLTGEFWELSRGQIVLRLALITVAVLAVAAGVEEGLNLFRHTDAEVKVPPLRGLDPTPALIVMASAPKNPLQGPHWTAYKAFTKSSDSALQHVFIIHSDHEQSKASAEALAADIRATHPKITPWMDGLKTDQEDPEAVFATVNKAIKMAIQEVGGNPNDVVLDATGGTAMASVGAALAKLEHKDIILSYIPNNPNGSFGEVVKRVDLKVIPGTQPGFDKASDSAAATPA
jgi:hypothetical protein